MAKKEVIIDPHKVAIKTKNEKNRDQVNLGLYVFYFEKEDTAIIVVTVKGCTFTSFPAVFICSQ